MNKDKAILESIMLWEYLANHPEILAKEDLPEPLLSRIKDYKCYCPLCEVQHKAGKWCLPENKWDPDNFPGGCPGCPLDEAGQHCLNGDSPYNMWENEDRSEPHAQRIVDILKNGK